LLIKEKTKLDFPRLKKLKEEERQAKGSREMPKLKLTIEVGRD
jgi:hypothetical protein